MLDIKLKQKTIDNISKNVGLPYEQIVNITPEKEKEIIGDKIRFSKEVDYRKLGRGNPLLSRRRFLTIEEVESRLQRIR